MRFAYFCGVPVAYQREAAASAVDGLNRHVENAEELHLSVNWHAAIKNSKPKDIGVTRLSLGAEHFGIGPQINGRAHLSGEIYEVTTWRDESIFSNQYRLTGMVGETEECG